MTSIDARLAIPAGTAWVASALVIGHVELAVPVAIGFWALSGLLCALWLARTPSRSSDGWLPAAAVAVAAVALCVTSVAAASADRAPPALVEAADSGRYVEATLILSHTVSPSKDQFEATITQVDGAVLRTPVVVFGGAVDERLPLGSVVTVGGTLTATDPGDHASFLLFARGPAQLGAAPPLWFGWADGLREQFLRVTQTLPGDGGVLLAGLAIGDTTLVTERLDGAMKQSSLSHLTAVSGANCAIIVGLIMLAGAAIGIPRGVRIVASVCALIGFVILVTPEPSVLRAAVMAAIVLGALGSGRPARGLPVLCVAVVVLLALDPWLAREYGFVLSVLATAGLLVLASPLAAALARFLPHPLALGIAVPVAAQVACQPVLVLLDASLPTYGVVANLMAAPAAPVATVVGLASCLTASVLPPVGVALAWLAWLPSAWIAGVAMFFSQLPLARVPWLDGSGGVALLVGLSALALSALLGTGRLRRWTSLALCASLAIYGGVVGGGFAIDRAGRPDWQIAACDVGQGDAFIVRSAGEVALIDTGPLADRLADCLADLGVSHIDLLVITHFDLDHVGGLSAVVGKVDRALVGPTIEDNEAALLRELQQSGASVTTVAAGTVGVLGQLHWRVLWPPSKLGGIEPGNDASVVVEFRPGHECAGCLSSLFLGDLGETSQSRLLGAGGIAPVDVIKVSHHGSADQDTDLYLAAGATVGLIGAGENDYGHPNRLLLDMLADAGTTAKRTDRDGLILVAAGEGAATQGGVGSVRVWTER